MSRRTKVLLAASFVMVLGLVVGARLSRTCVSASLRYGVTVPTCPDGAVHVGLELTTEELRRGQKGRVQISATMLYAVAGEANARAAQLDRVDVELSLLRRMEGREEEVAPLPFDKEGRVPGGGDVTLPADLEDGDYTLRARARTRAGEATLDAPLAVYAPAKVHLITDRPLYEPGHTVKFRGVILRARDLAPLDGRPGRFIVTDPSGVIVLDERAVAGEFGIVDGELPLDQSSPPGPWRVRYESGAASDEVVVDVRPFTLPRFTVAVEPVKQFYRAGEDPRVRIDVRSAAGVPVAAELDLAWSARGAWPPPPPWLEALPQKATTDRGGRAELSLPRVPADLVGKVQLQVTVGARDGAGDREVGQASVLLAQDAIDVSVLTELSAGGPPGLVAGVNNRAYLRVSTAAGAPLRGASLKITRAWDASDKGITAETDEDGVAAIQIDPGPAVQIVVPPLPVRLPPPAAAVERIQLEELLFGDERLQDIAAFDRLNRVVEPCARFARAGAEVSLALRVEPSGLIARAASDGAAAKCVGDALVGKSLPAGPARVYQLSWRLRSPLADLEPEHVATAELPPGLHEELRVLLDDARSCLGRMTTDGALPRMIVWELLGNRFQASLAQDPAAVELLDEARARCVEQKMAAWMRPRSLLTSAAAAGHDEEQSLEPGFGAVRVRVVPVAAPDPGGAPRARATTMLGYELLVVATARGERGARDEHLGELRDELRDELLGETRVRIAPGVVPPIRLRASHVIAAPGDEVTIELLRGPDYTGELPETLSLTHAAGALEASVDKKKRAAVFKLPADREGWYEARFDSGVTRVFVPRATSLSVEVAPDKRAYRPGEMARLAVQTRERGEGVKAAVGLIGVDETLAQLAPLPGAGDMDRLVPRVTMSEAAFGVLDATALSLGRIRGKNAAAATALLVTSVPTPEEIDVSTFASASTSFDPLLPLADRFYTILEVLYAEVRSFEASAPPSDKLTPQRMGELWDRARVAARKKGEVTTDLFGRELELRLLPDDLLALTDPRLVVADGTRLDEDMEAMVRYVRRSR
jgi:hypothetical protein